MRLTISLDDDLYGFIKALSKTEDLSMSQVVNKLLRRVAAAPAEPIEAPSAAAPWATLQVRPGVIIRPDEAQRMEEEEDLARLATLGFKPK
jgi:hypothetical protein